MNYVYFSHYEKYFNALNGNTGIVTKANSLNLNCSNSIISIDSTFFKKISDSKWQEQGKQIIESSITTGMKNSLNNLSNFISDNLLKACDLSINHLLVKVKLIKEKEDILIALQNKLKEEENNLETLKKQEPSETKTVDGVEVNNEKHDEWVTKVNDKIIEINRIMAQIKLKIKEIEQLCAEANNVIAEIIALNGNMSAEEIVSMIPTPPITDLSNYEYISLLENSLDDNLKEVYQNLGLPNNIEIIDQIPLRYNIDIVAGLLEDNKYKDLILDYLEQYSVNPNFNMISSGFYDKYVDAGLLPPVENLKSNPQSIFDLKLFNYDNEALDAMSTTLNHVTYETMLPYYESGELDIFKEQQIRSIVYGSDFLVSFPYARNNEIENTMAWGVTDASSFVNIGGGHCHTFTEVTFYQSTSDFENSEPLKVKSGYKPGDESIYREVFGSSYIGTNKFADKFGEDTDFLEPGTVVALRGHIGTFVYEGVNTDTGEKVYITVESVKEESASNPTDNVQYSDSSGGFMYVSRSESEMNKYKYRLTEQDICNILEINDISELKPTYFEENYEKYCKI